MYVYVRTCLSNSECAFPARGYFIYVKCLHATKSAIKHLNVSMASGWYFMRASNIRAFASLLTAGAHRQPLWWLFTSHESFFFHYPSAYHSMSMCILPLSVIYLWCGVFFPPTFCILSSFHIPSHTLDTFLISDTKLVNERIHNRLNCVWSVRRASGKICS